MSSLFTPLQPRDNRHHRYKHTQLENEIRETMDALELRTAEAEARRLRADRGTAKLQREQVRTGRIGYMWIAGWVVVCTFMRVCPVGRCTLSAPSRTPSQPYLLPHARPPLQEQMVTAGRRHAALIVKWWLWGSLLAWLLAVIVSVLVSPVLAFILVVPVIALFLLVGYASSSVEMRVDIAQAKRAQHRRGDSSLAGPEDETEEFIGQLLGDAYYDGAGGGGYYRPGGAVDAGGGDGGVLRWVGGLLYGAGSGVVGGTKWLLGYDEGGNARHAKRD